MPAKPKQQRRRKYGPEVTARICEAIAETGRDIDGIAMGGISTATFYTWLTDKPEFSEAVEVAKAQFKSTSLPQLRTWAKQSLRNTLQAAAEGLELVTTTTVTGTQDGQEVSLETVQRKPMLVPINQAFAYVMGKDIDLISWVRQGVDLGVFPLAFVEELINDIDGVTARIRAKVEGRISPERSSQDRDTRIDPGVAIATALGLADPVGLPKAMDAGRKPPKNMGKVAADRG